MRRARVILLATLTLATLALPSLAARALAVAEHDDLDLRYPPDPDAGMRGFAPPLSLRAGPGGSAPMTLWLVCDSPRGIYPQVPTCDVPWRTLPAGQ